MTADLIIMLSVVTLSFGEYKFVTEVSSNKTVTTISQMSIRTNTEPNFTITVTSTAVVNMIRSIAVHTAITYLEPDASLRQNLGRGFTIPHFQLPDTRWGPFFEEGSKPLNMTAIIGSTINLDCRIGLLRDKTVSWLRRKPDSIHLLTVGRNAYSSDERITLSFRYPNNWRLEISPVTHHDEGIYECQVATHPPKIKRLFLKVIEPQISIVDEHGRKLIERYYKMGSSLDLKCIATELNNDNISERKVIWKHGEKLMNENLSLHSLVNSNTLVSTLRLTPIEKEHSGKYTCVIQGFASASVTVHVLNGELPAAVHQGDSTSITRSCRKKITLLLILLHTFFHYDNYN